MNSRRSGASCAAPWGMGLDLPSESHSQSWPHIRTPLAPFAKSPGLHATQIFWGGARYQYFFKAPQGIPCDARNQNRSFLHGGGSRGGWEIDLEGNEGEFGNALRHNPSGRPAGALSCENSAGGAPPICALLCGS